MKNKSCKFVIVVSAVAMMLTGCNAEQAEQPPVMQGGTKATTSVVTTVPSVNATTVPATVTTVPTTTPSTVPTTAPSAATTVPTMSTAPSSTEGTVPTTTGTTKPTTVQTTVTTTTCQHTYGQPEVIKAATCTEAGQRAAKCSKCGKVDSKGQETIPKLGHDWVYNEEESYAPLAPALCGYDCYNCSRCNKPTSVQVYMDEEMIAQYCREVEQVILSELNRYRVEAGQEPLTYLPGLSEVCQYRAYQIYEKFGDDVHNDDDIREAFTRFKYGIDAITREKKLVDLIPGYIPKEISPEENYWMTDGTEAVTGSFGCVNQTSNEYGIDAMARLRNSTGHWSYLGSDLYSYVGIGVYCGPDGCYANIWVSGTNYG